MNGSRIAIAGLGVAGGALAVLLARAGHRVTVFERAPRLGPVGAGFLLQSSGQSVLRDMGLLEQIESLSARLSGLEARTHRGRALSNLKPGRVLPGAFALGVHRGVLFETLRTAAGQAGAVIRPGVEISSARETATGIVPMNAGSDCGEFDLLAACDGARSQLRAVLFPALKNIRPCAAGALWGTGACHSVSDCVLQVTRGTRRLAGLLPVGGGRAAFFWGLHTDEREPLMARGFDAFQEEVTGLIPAAAETLRDLGSFDSLTWATWFHLRPRRLYSGRLVLLGDAAHAMNPHFGQGANLALLDAASLARNLDNLRAYERERHAPARYYGQLSAMLSPFFQSRMPLLGCLRDFGLPLLGSIPWFRRQMELTFAGVKDGYFKMLAGRAT